jgi:hypothetical protein
MPQIPTAGPIRPMSAPRMDPGAAAQPYREMAAGFESLGRLGEYGKQVLDTIKQAENHVQLLKAQNQINADLTAAELSFESRADYQEFADAAAKMAEELRKKYAKQYEKNPNVLEAVNLALDSKILDFQAGVERKRLRLMNEDAKAEAYKMVKSTVLEMAKADTEELKTAKRGELEANLSALVSSHLLTPSERDLMLQNVDADAEDAELIGLLNSMDPLIIKGTIENIENHKYPSLESTNPKHLATVKAALQDKLTQTASAQSKAMDEAAVNAADTALHQTWNINGMVDYISANKQLEDPGFQKKYGLVDANGNRDVDRINKVRSSLVASEAMQNKQIDAEHDKYEGEVADAYVKEDFIAVEKMLESAGSRLTPDEKGKWKNSILERRKQREDKYNDVRQAQAIMRVVEEIRRGRLTPRQIETMIVQSNLEKNDMEEMIKSLHTKLDKDIRQARDEGFGDIADLIDPKGRQLMLQPLTALTNGEREKVKDIMNAQMSLDIWIRKELEAGRDPKPADIKIKAWGLADGTISSKVADKLK